MLLVLNAFKQGGIGVFTVRGEEGGVAKAGGENLR